MFLDRILGGLRGGSLGVVLWDGRHRTYGSGESAGTLTLRRPGALLRLLRNPEVGFGECYMDGSIDFDGDLHDLVLLWSRNRRLRSRAHHVRVPRREVRREQANIAHHYDLGNEFFSLFLDPTMTYSCAYFRHADDSLETAQRQKVQHTLAKLRLQPGQRLLDIGCGWGQMAMAAAERWGVQADGITLSRAQVEAVEQRVRERGLAGQVSVALRDYRDQATRPERYDAIVSVGMMEHVGQRNLGAFVDAVAAMLKPGGVALLHCMTRPKEAVPSPWTMKYIFPGGYIPSFRELMHHYGERDLHVHDAENLWEHYALTLDRWAENFEARLPQVRDLIAQGGLQQGWARGLSPEPFIRMWRLYLRGAAAAFRSGSVDIHQVLIANGRPNSLPLTREDLYRSVRSEQPAVEEPVREPDHRPL